MRLGRFRHERPSYRHDGILTRPILPVALTIGPLHGLTRWFLSVFLSALHVLVRTASYP